MQTIKTLFMGAILALAAISFSACDSEVPAGNPIKGSWESLDGTTVYSFDKDGSITYTKTTETEEERRGEPSYSIWTKTITKKTGTYFLTKESVVIKYTYKETGTTERREDEEYSDYNIWDWDVEIEDEHNSSETFAYVVDGDRLLLGKRDSSGAISEGNIYNKQ